MVGEKISQHQAKEERENHWNFDNVQKAYGARGYEASSQAKEEMEDEQ
jgi:hypothetical protein